MSNTVTLTVQADNYLEYFAINGTNYTSSFNSSYVAQIEVSKNTTLNWTTEGEDEFGDIIFSPYNPASGTLNLNENYTLILR